MKTVETTKRIAKVLIDGKHRKSFPLFIAGLIEKIPESEINKMSKGLRLNDKDRKISSPYIFDKIVYDYFEDIKREEPYVFELLSKSTVVGVRKVNTKFAEDKFEILMSDNNLSVKCPEYIYQFSNNKLTDINRMY